jgi:cyclic pyranopterin phosphate synthase
MREEHESAPGKAAMLDRHEIGTIIEVLAGLGVTKVRLTGGEPLLRRDIVEIVRHAKNTTGIKTVSLTTNGLLLHRYLPDLIDAGLDAINISIDTLDAERFRTITRRDEYRRVKENLDMLLKAENVAVKLNVVLMRDINSDELHRFVDLTGEHAVTVRFMELQPFDDHQIWRTGKFFSADKIRDRLENDYPDIAQSRGSSTQYFSYALPGHKGSIAIIPAFTRNFCSRCNRIRITSTGKIISCLYEKEGLNLLPLLRANASHESITALFREAVSTKPEDGKHAARDSKRTSMSEIGG